MSQETDELIEAFREDHIVLGRGFARISELLRSADIQRARERAIELDTVAGAHIAFEEQVFYPILEEMLGKEEVARLHEEHRTGFSVIKKLTSLKSGERPGDEIIATMLAHSETMEAHIAECGELFHALRQLPETQRAELLKELKCWRERQPAWREVEAASRDLAQDRKPQ